VTLFAFRDEASRAKGIVSGDSLQKHTEGNFGTIPALIFLTLATLRTCLAIAFPVPRTTARWIGARGLNAAVDAALVTAMTAATILPTKRRNWSMPWEWAHKQGFIAAWVTIPLYALAALDTGSPDRFYMQMGRPSGGVDFRFRREEWDIEAREMAERRALEACTTSAQDAVWRCYDQECGCSELDAFVGCYYTYCPGYGGADGGGVAGRFTCVGTRPVTRFPTASSGRAASSEATQTDSDGVGPSSTGSSGGVGGGNTESRVTPTLTPMSTSTPTGTDSSGSINEQPAPTSTNEAGMLFAPAGALLGSFIGILAML
ncbi:hypothetical protein V490_06383, partial [Pseudogymnoascus sp. VKM F-3557]